MTFDDISELSLETTTGLIRIRIFSLENGKLLLISDRERYRLGISAVAIPPSQGSSEPTSTALFTMGIDITLVRTLAERISSWTNSTCMVVLGISQFNRELMMEILLILKKHLLS